MTSLATRLKIDAVELVEIGIPLVSPFRTSFGTQTARTVLLLHLMADGVEGWGECVAMEEPLYSSEYVEGAQDVLQRHLLPRVFAAGPISVEELGTLLEPIKGHRMAKAGLEMAWLDAQLRLEGCSLAAYLGADKDAVDCGVSVGIMDSVPQLLDAVSGYLDEGYKRIKLKIEPGWDIEPVGAVRERFGPDLLLQVDANTAYTLADADHLAKLDQFNLLLIEQPMPEEEVLAHARLSEVIKTPVCLDESIVSAKVATEALDMKACAIINIKPGRVGGYLEAVRIHDVCRERGVPVWCGGMLETGIGRAANLALAALPNFTLPGDTSASKRYYKEDITEPFVLENGQIRVPQGPGLGVDVRRDFVDEITKAKELIKAG